MTPEAQRIAIAKACGWNTKKEVLGSVYIYRDPKGNIAAGLPNYLNDLNAMHEAEKILTEIQVPSYLNRLAEATPAKRDNRYGYWPMVCATAAQRAEAFLRTKGLWVE